MNDDEQLSLKDPHEENQMPPPRRSTVGALLEHLGKWEGDDLERCLAELKATRGGFWFDEEGYLVPSPQRVLHIATESGEEIDIDVTDIQDIESIGKPWYGPDSTGASLLELVKNLPDWAGDDGDESLEDVIRSRTLTRF